MKRYTNYKDSEIEWIGEIPDHWGVERIKDYTYLKARIGWQGLRSDEFIDNSDWYCLTGTDFLDGKIDWRNCYSIDKERFEQDKKIQLKINDLLITKDGTIGKIALVNNLPKPTTLNSGVFVSRPLLKKYTNNFMYWILSSDMFSRFIDLNKNGTTILHLYQNVFERFYYCLPTLPEQSNIVKYLDSKTISIDRKIELLTSKANKYKALRRSLINETVCRGLNPDTPLKDSGVEWVGMIPAHWAVKRFKDIASSITGLTYSPDDIVEERDGVLVLRSGNIQNGELSFNDNVYVNSTIGKNLFVRKGDILLCSRNGSANLVGKSACIDKSYNYSWGAFMTVARSRMGRFLFYALNSDLFKRNMGLFQTSTVNQLTSKMLDNMAFLVPPKKEQIDIINYLDEKTAQIDAIVSNIEQQITKLTQLRKSLINDVVTGKLKVTEA